MNPSAWIGLAIVTFVCLGAALAPYLAPYDPTRSSVGFLEGPGLQHWFGTDELGRDILSRIIWGARTVLIVAPIAVVIAYTIGCAMGLVAGYKGGWYDAVLARQR